MVQWHNIWIISFAEVGPKRILDLMDVPWLTRDNVASHLQVNSLHLVISCLYLLKLLHLLSFGKKIISCVLFEGYTTQSGVAVGTLAILSVLYRKNYPKAACS